MSLISGDINRSGAPVLMALTLALGTLVSGKIGVQVAYRSQESTGTGRPNILLLVADDLGYDDSTLFNSASAARTPGLAQLAAEGIRFSRHYADSTCTPSRVAILTGRYPERMGFRQTGLEIPPEFITLPEALREAGYQTHLVGKWHAGEARTESLPLAQGFDTFFGFHNQWELAGEIPPGRQGEQRPTYRDPWLRDGSDAPQQYSGHLTEILAQRSLQTIKSGQGAETPWFLYHGFFAPHAPIQPDDRFSSRWANTPEGRYLALVSQMDDAVARLLAMLESTGQADNTLVIFISDNGGTNIERNNNHPWRGKKDETFEGSFRTPLLIRMPNSQAAGGSVGEVVMNVDLYPTIRELSGLPALNDLDGVSLLPTILHGTPPVAAGRSWEKYLWNVDAMTYSYLSVDGRWRLSNMFGFPPELYDLKQNPAGDTNVADHRGGITSRLLAEFREASWRKSLLQATTAAGTEQGATVYSGFDLMRTPLRHSFAIGLGIPAPAAMSRNRVIAEQAGVWRLSEGAGDRLELSLRNYTMHARPLDRDRCNRVVITGHFQPQAMYTKTEVSQVVKLYVNGFLEDLVRDIPYVSPSPSIAGSPTVTYDGAHAVFSNLLLGTPGDPYYPQVAVERRELFAQLRDQGQLERTDIGKMMDMLCLPAR